MDRKIQKIEERLIRIQRSTKTLFPFMTPAHEYCREHSKSYYFWHTLRFANATHWLFLILFIAGTVFGYYGMFSAQKVEKSHAAVGMTALTSGSGNGTGGSDDFTTASISPSADSFVMVIVESSQAGEMSSPPTSPTNVTGNNLTWYDAAKDITVPFRDIGSGLVPLSIISYWYGTGSSPTSGSVTITTPDTDGTVTWSIMEFTGITMDTETKSAIRQFNFNSSADSAVPSLSIGLSPFGSTNNATFAVFGAGSNVAINPDSGWTEIHDVGATDNRLESAWYNGNDTTITGTMSSGSAYMGGIAFEIVAAPPTITGVCKQSDHSTNCTNSETVKVAYGTSVQAETGSTSSGAWTISVSALPSSGQVVTVFIDGVADANEANAVTKYDGSGNITGVLLYETHLAIGSGDNQTLTNSDISTYDNSVSGDEDIFFNVDTSNDLTTGLSTPPTGSFNLKTGNTYRPDSANSGNLAAHDIEIDGTVTADGNTLNANGKWDNNSVFTAGTSTVILSATSGTETIDSTGASTASFNNLRLYYSGDANATYNLSSALDVNGDLTITSDTLAMNGTNNINLAGNLSIGVSGNYTKGTGTFTFDGTTGGSGTVGTQSKIDDAGDPGALPIASRQLVRTSGGTLYAFINDGGSCEIWKSADGTSWSEQDSSNNPACTTGRAIAAAIDSSGSIHIAYTTTDININYNTFSTSADTFGTAATAVSLGSYDTTDLDLAVDSNSIPHLVYGYADSSGLNYAAKYSNRVGGSWKSPVDIETNSGDVYPFVSNSIVINEDNIAEVAYIDLPDDTVNAAVGNANNASSFTLADVDTGVNDVDGERGVTIAVDSGGNTWVGYTKKTTNYATLKEHADGDGWTTWSSEITNSNVGYEPSITTSGTDIYLFYEDDAADIVFDKYNGSFAGETVVAAGTYQNAHAKSSYLYNNGSSTQVDVLYSDGTDVYWNKYTLPVASTTWTDSRTTKADMGAVAINGTTKVVNLGSSATATSLDIKSSQTFGLGSSGYTFTLTGSGTDASRPLIVSGTLNEGTSTIVYTGTSATTITNETYNNLELKPTSGSPTYTMGITGGGSIVVAGTFTVGNGSNAITANADTYDPTIDVAGVFTIASSASFTASATGTLSAASTFTNSGTFTHSSGTLTLDGSSTQTVTCGSSTFNNITSTNSSGLTFSGNCTTAGTFAHNTGSTTLTFGAGSTYAFNAIDIDGTATHLITLASSSPGTAWYLNVTAASPTVTYVTPSYSDASGGSKIIASDGTSVDGEHNVNWDFTGNVGPVNDSLTFTNPYGGSGNTVIADDTVEWNFQAKVTDDDGATDINYIELRMANAVDSSLPYDSLKFRYTRSTDTFSEVADTQSAATLTSTSGDATSAGNQWTVNFKVQFNANFLDKSTNYSAELYSIDIYPASDDTNYTGFYKVESLALTLDVDSATVAFGNLLPGSVVTGTTVATVDTNYPNGYSLAIHDSVPGAWSALLHTDSTTRIADYAGTIATPTLWSGTGLGVCVYSATSKEVKWGTGTTEADSNNKYAGVPETAGIIHTKTGSPTVSDATSIGYKVVVPTTQKTGSYSGIETYTATGVLE